MERIVQKGLQSLFNVLLEHLEQVLRIITMFYHHVLDVDLDSTQMMEEAVLIVMQDMFA